MKSCPTVPEELNRRLRELAPRIVLASQSPNRLLLLRDAGIDVTARPQDVDESYPSSDPDSVVSHISRIKLNSYMASNEFESGTVAICCDTMVLFEGRLLGKPHSREEAYNMLKEFSGKEQKVLSGYSLYIPGKGAVSGTDESTVYFEKLSEKDIQDYLDTEDYIGAAGSYRIQRSGYALVERIEGSWTNVVGLPFERIIEELSK